MILAGLGFGFFPEYCVTTPGLVTRPLVEPELIRSIGLVTVRGRPHSPAVGAFVRAVRAHRWPTKPSPLPGMPPADLSDGAQPGL
jgi:DNA-binding transcriptional LysR family regulator